MDTNVFLYARGGEHPYRPACRQILRAAQLQRITLEASVELVQEFTHVLLRRSVPRLQVLSEADEVAAQCRLRDFDADVLRTALGLLHRHEHLASRDAVHAATALRAGLTDVVSTDRAFDSVDGLRRVDPIELAEES